MDDPSHSGLYLSSGTLPQNEVGISLKWGRGGLTKTQNLEKKYMCRERFCQVIHNFFFEHIWHSDMKFLPCSEHISGPLHLKIFQPD